MSFKRFGLRNFDFCLCGNLSSAEFSLISCLNSLLSKSIAVSWGVSVSQFLSKGQTPCREPSSLIQRRHGKIHLAGDALLVMMLNKQQNNFEFFQQHDNFHTVSCVFGVSYFHLLSACSLILSCAVTGRCWNESEDDDCVSGTR
jgi:hypothetical protein